MSDDGFQIDLQEARTAAEHDFPDLATHLGDQAQTLLTVGTLSYAPPPSFDVGDYAGAAPYEYQADEQTFSTLRTAFDEYLSELTSYMSEASSVVDQTGEALRKIIQLYARADGQE
jgi:hypothetical protein